MVLQNPNLGVKLWTNDPNSTNLLLRFGLLRSQGVGYIRAYSVPK